MLGTFKYLMSVNSLSVRQSDAKWAFVQSTNLSNSILMWGQVSPTPLLFPILTSKFYQISLNGFLTFWGLLNRSTLRHALKENSNIIRRMFCYRRYCSKPVSKALKAGSEAPPSKSRKGQLKQANWFVQLFRGGLIGFKTQALYPCIPMATS